MKRFLLLCSFFASLILLVLVGMEIAVTCVPNPYKAKHDYIKANGSTIEILVLGSSHTFMGVNPQLLDKLAYSLANVSQSLNVDCRLLEKYIDDLPQLKCVVLPISAFSFYSDICDKDNSDNFRLTYYRKYMDVDLSSWYENRFEVLNISSAVVKVRRSDVQRKDCLGMTDSGQSTGYFLFNKSQSQNWESAKERVKSHTFHGEPIPELVESLNRIAQICDSRGVELILVTTPTRKNYYELLDFAQLVLMRGVVDSVTIKYENVYYYDFLKHEDFQQSPDFFYDADHLTDVGANYFTTILADTLSKREISKI